MYLHKVKLHLHLGPSASLKFQLWTFNYHIIITSPWHCAVWECKIKSCFREITIRRGVWVHSSTKDPKTGSWAKLKGWDHCNKSFGNSLLDISNLKRWLRYSVQFSSGTQSSLTLRPHESQHARPPCPSPTPRVHSNSCPSTSWCHPAISSSVIPFFSYSQSFPASGSFPMTQLFTWGGHSTGVSALASVLSTNTQDWCPLRWTSWTSVQSKGLSRVFSNTTIQKHQFFGAQLSSQSNSHIHTWPLEKP